jgi:hypothetical protein
MKRIMLSFGIVLASVTLSMAQDHSHEQGTAVATPPTTLKPENLEFKTESHDFGTVPEGPAAEYEFVFKNTGKEPILLQQVHASCGCTTPTWSKDPVLPGKTGIVKASFATQGRGGSPFNKSITVTSNAGTKVLTIKGNVEKAPENSVPENTSMIKTN